jgi:hypothetical protein
MTAPKSTLRSRRRTTIENLPRTLVAWFAGEPRPDGRSSVPWSALAFPDWCFLPERWQIWKALHPGACPPAGFEWLDDPGSPQHPTAWQLEQARKVAERPAQ